MNEFLEEPEDEGRVGWAAHKFPIILGSLVAIGAGYVVMKPPTGQASAPKPPEMAIVAVKLPPTPPPPPPPPPPKVEEKMEEQKDIQEPEPEAPDPTPQVATNNTGGGKTIAGLGGRGSALKQMKIGGSKGGRFDGYARQVQSAITTALKRHNKVKSATMNVEVQIWVDSTGKVTRAALKRSTGDSKLDQALTQEVLASCQLPEPPPSDMKMPINLSVSGQRSAYASTP